MLQSLEAGQVTWGQGKDRETLGEEKPFNTPLSHFGILSELNKQHLKTSASSCLMWSAWVFSSSTAFLSLGICSDTFLSLSSPVRLPVSLPVSFWSQLGWVCWRLWFASSLSKQCIVWWQLQVWGPVLPVPLAGTVLVGYKVKFCLDKLQGLVPGEQGIPTGTLGTPIGSSLFGWWFHPSTLVGAWLLPA